MNLTTNKVQFSTFLLSFILLFGNINNTKADEGMWIPMLLEKYNIGIMKEKGFMLTAENIYSVNQACLKDAVMIFGRGCTAELVSDEGLIFTNHHCGFGAIQKHSSIENDYLTNGFWAKNKSEELSNSDLTVTFLKRMEDVTTIVLEGVTDSLSEVEREKLVKANSQKIVAEAIKDTHYKALIKPFFYGNQYFLFVNEVFEDVRLVGAPPSAIGKFGGDTDNWMWPRHTGDFSVFRIYANANNQPAKYSSDNVPFKPIKHLKISLKGVKENDFTMVFGYPASTTQYVPSYYLQLVKNTLNPALVDVRGKKLEIIKKYMNQNPTIRIQYAAKDASIANAWKKWIGETKGLDKFNAIEKKQTYEAKFQKWANLSGNEAYQQLLPQLENAYVDYSRYKLAENYISEFIWRNGIEIANLAGRFEKLADLLNGESVNENKLSKLLVDLKTESELFFKDFNANVDKDLAIMLLSEYKQKMDIAFQPDIYKVIEKRYNNSNERYADFLFRRSIFTNKEAIEKLLTLPTKENAKIIIKDPAFLLFKSFNDLYYNHIYNNMNDLNSTLNRLMRKYMEAQMAFEPEHIFYPDANFTLRLTYGNVAGYNGADAIGYKYFTTLQGIMEKDNPEIYDYNVPQRLRDLYKTKDYGVYGNNGSLPICFIATNHTTGGNSGSPVLNANGELIGINFDRAWEGVMSDLVYNPAQARNIALDIRYVLFIIDKLAGASYLLDEMDFAKE